MRLIVEPGAQYRWQEFKAFAPFRSIALDGYVLEGPRYDFHRSRGPWANFNHHHEVSRLETRATCAQVLMALRQGLIPAFADEKGGTDDVSIYVNDCDEDVCLSVYLLENYDRVRMVYNPMLNRLVHMEDMLDTTGGAYGFPSDLESMQQLLWVFQPYHELRTSGKIHDGNADDFRAVIHHVGARIDRYIVGNARKISPDTRFSVVDAGTSWSMIEEIGVNARLGVYGSGIKAFVSVRKIDGERHAYSIGRASQYIDFPIPKILNALNRAEKHAQRGMLSVMPSGQWGGSDLIAGSPRISGSVLSPERVKEVIEEAIRTGCRDY